MGTGSSTIQFTSKIRAISPEEEQGKIPMLSQGQSMAGGEQLAAAFWWVDKTGSTFPASKAMGQFHQTIRNSFEMHLTLTITLNIQQFVSSQHKVWIFCLQEKAMDIIQEKPCTHLRIYSTEFKNFITFVFKIHPERHKMCVSSAQAFTRHVETVTTQGTIDEALENALVGIWSHFCDLMATMSCKTPLAGVFPSHLRFLEAPEGKA